MIPTYKTPYKDGDLRTGWASWDNGSMTARSIKYAYQDASGKISRGAPELPFDILMNMAAVACEQNEYSFKENLGTSLDSATKEELLEAREKLRIALLLMQKLIHDLPWLSSMAKQYDEVGARYELIKNALSKK